MHILRSNKGKPCNSCTKKKEGVEYTDTQPWCNKKQNAAMKCSPLDDYSRGQSNPSNHLAIYILNTELS
jgi:hypothetical protein